MVVPVSDGNHSWSSNSFWGSGKPEWEISNCGSCWQLEKNPYFLLLPVTQRTSPKKFSEWTMPYLLEDKFESSKLPVQLHWIVSHSLTILLHSLGCARLLFDSTWPLLLAKELKELARSYRLLSLSQQHLNLGNWEISQFYSLIHLPFFLSVYSKNCWGYNSSYNITLGVHNNIHILY